MAERAQVSCGVWRAERRLVVALVGPDSKPRRVIRSALTDDARYGLIEYLAIAGTDLIVSEALTRVDLLPSHAARRGLVVWTVSDAFVAALLRAAAIRDPARAAALLGRLTFIPLLRGSLRRIGSVAAHPQQLPFLGLTTR